MPSAEFPSLEAMHTVRLNGPWEVRPHDSGSIKAIEWRKLKFPCTPTDLGTGQIVIARRFQSPSNLEPADRVFLFVPDFFAISVAQLNGQPLDSMQTPAIERQDTAFTAKRCDYCIEITSHLQQSNRVEMEVTLSAQNVTDTNPIEPILLGILAASDSSPA